MAKILICDDEGIVRESLQFIIKKNFGSTCELTCARNGRMAIELAEELRPDIVMMDIQMPGINGLEAMSEIRRENPHTVFIVLTAFDSFEYSKAAIDVGVLSYLTKPINRDVLCEVLRKAIRHVEERKRKVTSDLVIKEKMEAVVPLLESGFIYNMILENTGSDGDKMSYRELLGIEEDYGYAIVVMCGDDISDGGLTNPVGAGIRLQKEILTFRATVKETLHAIVGEVMANKVIILVPSVHETEEYAERIKKIDIVRALLRRLHQQIGLMFKAGIGTVISWSRIAESYREAGETLRQGIGRVTHAGDLPVSCVYEDAYPYELENDLFYHIEKGDVQKTRTLSLQFFEWMEGHLSRMNNSVRLKTIEFILRAESIAYMQGGMVYHFDQREGYLDTLMNIGTYEELKAYFLHKMEEAVVHIAMQRKEKSDSVVEKAKSYIKDNFQMELSLEQLAKMIGISPYYLSKLFKELEGENYIEYVTKLRIEYAKEALRDTSKSIKEICHETGYSDPNYFSRIFKKWTGTTPTEYRG